VVGVSDCSSIIVNSCNVYDGMCLAVYVGIEEEIVDRSGRLYIAPADCEQDQPVGQVILGRVYYVATREGCGCGFRKRKYRAPLVSLVARVARRCPAHIYICWEGEQGWRPVETKHVSVSHLGEFDKFLTGDWPTPILFLVSPENE
jgi:hypothetical protein